MSGERDAHAALLEGVERGTKLCWQGYNDRGQPVDTGDGEPHYYERAEIPENLNPKHLDGPCWHVQCVGCGYTFDEEGTWITHFASAEDAVTVTVDRCWLLIDGGLYCNAECEGLPSPGDAATQADR